MRWKSHAVVTGSFLFAMGYGPGNILLGMISSALPDWIETPFGLHFRILPHRGLSHEVIFYLLPFLVLIFGYPELNWPPPIVWDQNGLSHLPIYSMIPQSFVGAHAFQVSAWVIPLGGLLHLLLGDIFNPGGVTMFFKRESFRWFYTDSPYRTSWGERFFTLSLFLASLGIYYLSHKPLFLKIAQVVMPIMVAYWYVVAAIIVLAILAIKVPLHFFNKKVEPQKLLPESTISIANLPYRKKAKTQHADNSPKPSSASVQNNPKQELPVALPSIPISRWRTFEIQNFWKTDIVPCLASFVREPSLVDPLLALLDILDKEGDVPSVCGADDEKRFTESSFDRLAKVSLRDHLLHVAIDGKALLKAQFGQYFMLSYPKFVIAALGHDIGKCPTYTQGGYTSGDHPIISANVVSGLLGEHPFTTDIVLAIRDHHRKAPVDQMPVFCALLIRADQLSRDKESNASHIKHLSRDKREQAAKGSPLQAAIPKGPEITTTLPAKPPVIPPNKPRSSVPESRHIPENFPMDKLLEKMRAKTNYCHPTRPAFWLSLSQSDGTVYFHVDFLHALVSETAEDAGISDLWFFDRDHRNSLLFSIFQVWRKKNWAAGNVGPTFYFNTYDAENTQQNTRSKVLLVGIKVEALGISVMTAERERLENNATRHVHISFKAVKNP